MKSSATALTLSSVFACLFFPAILLAQPANNNCAGAVQLTSNTSCSTLANQTLNKATDSAGYPTGCLIGTHYDVWYYFTAMATSETVTISSVGANINNPELQVLSGSCNSMTSIQCAGGSTITASGLSIGVKYYVRVSNVGTDPTGSGNGPKFDICVTHAAPPVANDECTGAISLTSNSTCNNTLGTLISATASPGVPSGCASAGTHYDVWYSFVAVTPIETITFTKVSPSNISNPELQLFSGSCGSLTSLQCGTTSISATGLTTGNTYYVRVSQVGGSALTTKGDFNICVRHSAPTPPNIDYSKSYVNITKGNGGGTVSPGDILEIRATMVVRSGASSTVDSLSLLDTLAAGEGLQFVSGSLALRTNEGKLYKSFTDGVDADAGWHTASVNNSADTVIQINFGSGASNTARGALTNTSKPSVFGSTCIIMATYRVVVTAAYGTTINLGGGELTMHNSSGYSDLIFPPRNVMVYQSPGLCPNAVSATNAIGGDFNGTFGTPSGPPLAKNRGTSPNVPSYIYAAFTTGAPQDYYYGITNNTGAGGASFTTTTTWAKPDPSAPTHRVFNVWDITGDHTGATNTAKGNPPCDTTKAISATNPCGYMLVINSAYKTDTAFTYGVTNLCPNTYYEISAWVKNICYKCSCDSNGLGASASPNTGYIPFAPNDSSGVQPNLAFDIDGIDYYTTGNIPYAGIFPTTQAGSDSTNIWVKRGFTYLTGAAQTSLTMTIRNNAPGGGGNDWALDDIALATCLPNMQYSPMLNPTLCQNTPGYDIRDTVRSYFNNYSNYKWQKSTDGGATWTDVTSAASVTPTWNGSAYQYITTYNIPQGSLTMADNGTKYRVVVGTTSSNLSNTACTVTDGVSIITLTVNDCVPVLDVNLLSFNGKMSNHKASLFWRTSKEYESVSFTIEKSTDGIHFSPIASLNGHGNNSQNNYYTFTDPVTVTGAAFYRIGMMSASGKIKYSQVISLRDGSLVFELMNAVNPFSNEINFEISAPQDAKVEAVLTNIAGKPLRKQTFVVYEGVNSLTIPGVETLPVGMYILQVNYQGEVVNRKLMKR